MDFSNVHILLCDHDPSTGSETLALLQKCSYKVSSVKTAQQAVDALESEGSTVDVVLTDVELPKEESFKVLKYILRKEELGHIAVVVMSEHDEMALVAKCLSLGAVDYLVKPLRLNEVTNLWTHMWRKRRVMNLPDKELGIMSAKVSSNFPKPAETADLLSGYRRSEATPPATGSWHGAQAKEDYGSQVELSLRLSLNHTVGELPGHSCVASLSSQPSTGHRKASAFSTYLRSCNQQPDEQSGTNACSSSNSPPSKRSKSSNECVINGNQESAYGMLADASHGSSPKEASAADETRPTDMESQICDRSKKLRTEQVPPHCLSADERIFHGGQLSPVHLQGFQPCYAFMGLPPLNVRQGEAHNGPEATASTYDITANPPPGQAIPVYYHESGMATMPSVQNVFSCYPVAHLAVPVMNLSSWPPMGRPPPPVGGKVIQAERREAALNKFRMKRKGRCFEKKIRYASRKKLAEQRPRVRGQFVKRSALAEHIETQAASDEEGEADDEQGCSELDNQSSPDCAAEN